MRLLYDLEANGLLDEATCVHMISLIDVDNPDAEVQAFHDDPTLTPRHGSIDEGLEMLSNATQLIGHNIVGYDNPLLKKLFGLDIELERSWDTLIASRLAYSDRREQDFLLNEKGQLEGKFIGGHGLAAWGARLGESKIEYDGGWRTFNQDMLTYGIQDVVTNLVLYRKLVKELEGLEDVFEAEQRYAVMLYDMETVGIQIDIEAAERLVMELDGKLADLEVQIQKDFPPAFVDHKPYPNGNPRLIKCRYRGTREPNKMIPFDPGSRMQLARRLQETRGWTPTELTQKGSPKMSEDVLMALADLYPEVKAVAEYHVIKARLATIRDGNHSYFRLVDHKGIIHPRYHHVGAVTHRSASSKPNGQNVVSISKPYGKEIRSLFLPHKGYKQAAFDLAAVELRLLVHYLARWDEGAYATVVTTGDVHQHHADAISTVVPCDRSTSKGLTYGYLYGAGDSKLGEMMGGKRQLGGRIRHGLQSRILGLGPLNDQLKQVIAAKGSIRALDGRRVGVRHEHAGLNTLLQSASAVAMRYTLLFLREELESRGVAWGDDFIATGLIHDEVQGSLRSGLEDKFSEAVEASLVRVTDYLNLRCPLGGTPMFGESWADTH